MSEIVFTIDKDIPPERLEEYKKALNELIGYDAEWTVEPKPMNEIEIRERARELPEDIRNEAYRLAYAWAMPDEAALDGATESIARSLLAIRDAERERAAQIAETTGVHPATNAYAEWYKHAQRIAAAIRAR